MMVIFVRLYHWVCLRVVDYKGAVIFIVPVKPRIFMPWRGLIGFMFIKNSNHRKGSKYVAATVAFFF
jgi:hypothetical protein